MKVPPKKVRIVECSSIEFIGKDIICIEHWEDFIYLIFDDKVIYKLKNNYYLIGPDVAWMYTD